MLSRLNPVPSFSDFTGPYKVGTVDVEIPVSELDSPAPAPDNAADIETVQFRVFYPTSPEAQDKRITWLPSPQRDHLSAYIQFLGAPSLLAQAISFLPRHLHYTSIPVVKNAPISQPNTPNGRWPTAIFSHGLGGSRNAYSQIAGSLASHGVVVVCPEHRDGSAVASFIRIPSQQDRFFTRSTRRAVPYLRVKHDATDEVYALRNDQLRIRLWELGLIHEAILGIDKGEPLTNLNKSTPSLDTFVGNLHVHMPGSIIFAGHSFGSATMVQFLKSVFYIGHPKLEAMPEQLYVPSRQSSICKQITSRNITILLDMWCMPLRAKSTKPLFDLPLPVYAVSPTNPMPPGGSALLAVESSDFYNWEDHLHETARALSPDPSAPTVQATAFYKGNASGVKLAEPHFFYVERSAHLSQSDFGILFPWLMRQVYKSEEPERALRLNRRAILQVLRANGVPVARTWAGDLVDGTDTGKIIVDNVSADADVAISGVHDAEAGAGAVSPAEGDGSDDRAILDRSGRSVVDAWHWIDIVNMGQAEEVNEDGSNEGVAEQEPGMAGVIEPHANENTAETATAGST